MPWSKFNVLQTPPPPMSYTVKTLHVLHFNISCQMHETSPSVWQIFRTKLKVLVRLPHPKTPPQKTPKQHTDSECSNAHREICPRNLFGSKEKHSAAVDPEEALSTRIGTAKYFIASTVFCLTEALMRNNWNQSPPTDDGDDSQWGASVCIKPQSGSSLQPLTAAADGPALCTTHQSLQSLLRRTGFFFGFFFGRYIEQFSPAKN